MNRRHPFAGQTCDTGMNLVFEQRTLSWSPKRTTMLAFYRMDESMVTQYPLVDITARVGEVNNVRYPMAGMTSHQVKVGIYNPATGKSIYLNAGDPTDRYFTNISWSPDEKAST